MDIVPNILYDDRRLEHFPLIVEEMKRQNIVNYKWVSPIMSNSVVKSINISQKSIVQKAKDNGEEMVCIIEQDIMFPSENGWQYFLENIPKDFDVYIGGTYLIDNGYVSSKDLPDGVQERKHEYFNLLNNPDRPVLGSKKLNYHIISVDGIWRYEMLQWALDHFKGRGGLLIADNFDQDYVWISPLANELMMPYKDVEQIFYQPNHTNHEGKQWNTRIWHIQY